MTIEQDFATGHAACECKGSRTRLGEPNPDNWDAPTEPTPWPCDNPLHAALDRIVGYVKGLEGHLAILDAAHNVKMQDKPQGIAVHPRDIVRAAITKAEA